MAMKTGRHKISIALGSLWIYEYEGGCVWVLIIKQIIKKRRRETILEPDRNASEQETKCARII